MEKQIWNADARDSAIASFDSNSLYFYLTSTSDKEWVQISKALDVSVTTNPNIPNHVDVLRPTGCGGTLQIRDFSSVNLHSDLKSFTQESIFSEADFFTLQPNEFEIFSIPFDCNAPSYYSIYITAKYLYKGSSGVIEFPKFNILCPQSASVYSTSTNGSLIGVENFSWKNEKYIQSP